MAFLLTTTAQRYTCASADTKITDGIKTGSYLDETDTNKQYRFNGTAWVQTGYISGKSTATVTRPDDTTAYAAGDVVGGLLTFANVLGSAQQFILTAANLRIDVAAIPSGMGGFKLHLFDSAPTAIVDNAAFNIAAADRSKYIGSVSMATPVDLGDTLFSQNDNVNLNGKLATTSLYGYITTDAAFTPTALAVKVASIYCIGV